MSNFQPGIEELESKMESLADKLEKLEREIGRIDRSFSLLDYRIKEEAGRILEEIERIGPIGPAAFHDEENTESFSSSVASRFGSYPPEGAVAPSPYYSQKTEAYNPHQWHDFPSYPRKKIGFWRLLFTIIAFGAFVYFIFYYGFMRSLILPSLPGGSSSSVSISGGNPNAKEEGRREGESGSRESRKVAGDASSGKK